MVQLQCDICLKDIASLTEIGTLDAHYQVADRIKHVCPKCAKLVNAKIQKLSAYYATHMANDMREYVMELRSNHVKPT